MVSKYRDILEPPNPTSRSSSFSSQAGIVIWRTFHNRSCTWVSLHTFLTHKLWGQGTVTITITWASHHRSWLIIAAHVTTVTTSTLPTTNTCANAPAVETLAIPLTFVASAVHALHQLTNTHRMVQGTMWPLWPCKKTRWKFVYNNKHQLTITWMT